MTFIFTLFCGNPQIRNVLFPFLNLGKIDLDFKLKVKNKNIPYSSVDRNIFERFNNLNLNIQKGTFIGNSYGFYHLIYSGGNNLTNHIHGNELTFERKIFNNLYGENKKKFFYFFCVGTGIFKHLIDSLFGLKDENSIHYTPAPIDAIILLLLEDKISYSYYIKKYQKGDNLNLQDLINGLDDKFKQEKDFLLKIYNCNDQENLVEILNELYENVKDGIDFELDSNLDFKDGKFTQDLLTKIINVDINLYNSEKYIKSFSLLSSGEKSIIYRFAKIYDYIWKKQKYNGFLYILIDEPDLHLHLDWQRQYIQKLIDVFYQLPEYIRLHFIIATHSPFIISDLPSKSLVLLENGKQKEYEGQTFGANYVDLIRNGFFFQDKMLMGSFAKEVIGDVAKIKRFETLKGHINIESLNEKDKNIYSNFVENKIYGDEFLEKIEENIGDKFLKDNLLYFKPEKNDKS